MSLPVTALSAPPPVSDTAIRAAAKARLAEESGDASAALAALIAVAHADPASVGVRGRMLEQALIVGDQRRATEAAQLLWQAGEQRFDARMVLLVDAVQRGDWADARSLVQVDGAKTGLDLTGRLISPVVLAWIDVAARERDPARHLVRFGRIGDDQTPLWIGATILLLAGDRNAAVDQAETLNLNHRTSRVVAARLAATFAKRGDGAAASALATRLAGAPGDGLVARLSIPPVADARQGIGHWLALLGDGFARTPGGSNELSLLFTRAGQWLDPADPFGQIALAEALVQAKQVDGALAVLERGAAGAGAGNPFALRRAELLAERGEVDHAVAVAMPASGVLPTDRAWLTRFADVARRAKDPAVGEAVFDRLLALINDGEDDGELRAALFIAKADIRIKQGRWAEARPLLEAALAAGPNDPGTLNFVGYSALERRENIPLALARVKAAWLGDPANAAITDSLGWAYVVTGDVARGVPLLERAARGEPANAVINEHLGDAYWKSGRFIEARYSWRAAALVADDAMAGRLAAKLAGGLTEATLAP